MKAHLPGGRTIDVPALSARVQIPELPNVPETRAEWYGEAEKIPFPEDVRPARKISSKIYRLASIAVIPGGEFEGYYYVCG